jgi:hypothetical protein
VEATKPGVSENAEPATHNSLEMPFRIVLKCLSGQLAVQGKEFKCQFVGGANTRCETEMFIVRAVEFKFISNPPPLCRLADTLSPTSSHFYHIGAHYIGGRAMHISGLKYGGGDLNLR